MIERKSILNHNEVTLIFEFLLLSSTPFDPSHFFATLLPLEVTVKFFIEEQREFITLQKGLIIDIIRLGFCCGEIEFWPKDGVNTQSEQILHHSWN